MLYLLKFIRRTLTTVYIIHLLTGTSTLFSQSVSSLDNYTGNWEDPFSWYPAWDSVSTIITDTDIIVNGFITVNGNLNFYGSATSLVINDTLVVGGDLVLGNNNNVIINDNGVLIVRDSLKISNQTEITANGYLIVTNALSKVSAINQGSVTSNDNPVKIFICGSVSNVGLTDNNVSYPAINCTSPLTITYPNSNCSYGNLADLMNDQIYGFYQSLCTEWAPLIYSNGPLSFCEGDSVILTTGKDSAYLWSTGDTTQSISAKVSDAYYVTTTDKNGCHSLKSDTLNINVNKLPGQPLINPQSQASICQGDSITLSSSQGFGYLWSTGAHTQSINIKEEGNYSVQVLSDSGCLSKPSAPTILSVNPLPVVSFTGITGSMCSDGQINLTGDPPGGSFTVTDGPGIVAGNTLTATGPGIIHLMYSYTDQCPGSDYKYVNVDENILADAGPDQVLVYEFLTQMNASPALPGSGKWSLISGSGLFSDSTSPTTIITGLSAGINEFLWKIRNGSCVSDDMVKVEVKDIVTPTVFTPNDDGLNDELVFPGLNAFPGSQLIIFDRLGNEVYKNPDYNNDWKGKDNKSRDLKPDTYYYILKISNGRTIKGFIEIRR